MLRSQGRDRTSAVPITGVALASPLGRSLPELAAALAEGRRGLSKHHRFSALIDAPLGELGGGAPLSLYDLADGLVRRLAVETDLFERYAPEEIGLFLGTTTAGVEQWFLRLERSGEKPTPASLINSEDQIGSVAHRLKAAFPIRGIDMVVVTACSASAVALARARDAIRMGLVKCAVAGGFDVLTPMTIMGFDCLQILDHDFCRPFNADRKGLNLGEGGALFLLEGTGLTVPGDAPPPLAFLAGAGAASDAYHMTHPDPDGRGMELSMRNALADAGLAPSAIGYVNAHGTGTIPNDLTERLALDRIFGAGGVPVSSTKELHGHTLGGAGALEAAATLAALAQNQVWLPNQLPASRSREPLAHALSNSFGFGGNNVSLVFTAGSRLDFGEKNP